MTLDFIDISIPSGSLLFPMIFSILLYWILKSFSHQMIEQNEILDFEGNTNVSNYRTHAFWVSIFFLLAIFLFGLVLIFQASSILSLIGGSFIFIFPLLILAYGFYNVVMMIKYREPSDYKYWIGYIVISFLLSFIFFWLISFIGF